MPFWFCVILIRCVCSSGSCLSIKSDLCPFSDGRYRWVLTVEVCLLLVLCGSSLIVEAGPALSPLTSSNNKNVTVRQSACFQPLMWSDLDRLSYDAGRHHHLSESFRVCRVFCVLTAAVFEEEEQQFDVSVWAADFRFLTAQWWKVVFEHRGDVAMRTASGSSSSPSPSSAIKICSF